MPSGKAVHKCVTGYSTTRKRDHYKLLREMAMYVGEMKQKRLRRQLRPTDQHNEIKRKRKEIAYSR